MNRTQVGRVGLAQHVLSQVGMQRAVSEFPRVWRQFSLAVDENRLAEEALRLAEGKYECMNELMNK